MPPTLWEAQCGRHLPQRASAGAAVTVCKTTLSSFGMVTIWHPPRALRGLGQEEAGACPQVVRRCPHVAKYDVGRVELIAEGVP